MAAVPAGRRPAHRGAKRRRRRQRAQRHDRHRAIGRLQPRSGGRGRGALPAGRERRRRGAGAGEPAHPPVLLGYPHPALRRLRAAAIAARTGEAAISVGQPPGQRPGRPSGHAAVALAGVDLNLSVADYNALVGATSISTLCPACSRRAPGRPGHVRQHRLGGGRPLPTLVTAMADARDAGHRRLRAAQHRVNCPRPRSISPAS